ncbi:MAG: tetratricopeptide repeat protein [Candidatus Binatia bacterium]
MSNPRSDKKSRRGTSARVEAQPGHSSVPWAELFIPLAIFVLALSVRLFYLFQIESIPLFYHLAGDGRSYDEWAQRITAGDWLGREVFYQAPLYPYFLGLLQSILGHDLWSIRVVQVILGAVSCSLLYWAGRSFFSRGAGIVAGLILSLYAPAIFFDALIQKTVLDLLLITLLLLFLSRAQQKTHWSQWVTIGAVLGLLVLSRENALIWLLVVPIWIWFYFVMHQPRIRLGWVGIFLLGSTLVLVPVGLRNLEVGGEFALTTAQMGPNFFIGNNPEADGTYAPLRPGHSDPQFERQDATELAEQAVGRSLSPREVSRYWLQRSLGYISSQPIDWLRLMGRKWLMLWNVRELEDADDFYLYQKWSWLLKVLGWSNHFGLLAPIAAMGFVLTWRQWRRLWLLYLLLASVAFSVALFYVFGRYRFPMIPLLTLFAGAGFIHGFALIKEHRVREAVIGVAILLVTGAVVYWPVVDRAGPSAASYVNLSNALAKQGRIDEAIVNLQQALQVQPDYAVPHYSLGSLFAAQGKLEEARYNLQEAVRIDPDYAEAHNNLGNVLASQGKFENAIQHFRKALHLSPGRSEIHFNLANALVRQGYFEEAIEHFQETLKIKPNIAEAHYGLGALVAARGDLGKAIDHFRQAVRIQPEFAEAHENLGRALAQQGKRDEAVKHYQEALRILKSRQGPSVSR